jgi:glycosyltransferase involved in cell wall biosynthesis
MKILFVDHTGRPGGGQIGLRRYFERPSRHERELVVYEDGALAEWATTAGVRSTVLGWNGRNQSPSLLSAQLRAWWLLLISSSDVVVANSMNTAILISLLPKRKKFYIYYLREDLSLEWLSGTKRAVVVRWILPRFDAFLSNSEWTASTIPPQLKAKPMRVVYTMSGVQVTTDGPQSKPASGKLRILSLSRLVRWKGVHVLIQALALLQKRDLGDKVTATIAGEDLFDDGHDYVQDLKALADTLGDGVSFVGHVEDVRGLLDTHDILVSCSLNAEPFGQVIIQGMSSGLAVVATDQGGPKEVIEDGRTGILVPPGDAAALARAIESFILSPSSVHKMGDAAIAAARKYADAPMTELLESSIEKLIKELGSDVRRS